MPSLGSAEHLQPTLLDRLTDDSPQNTRESSERRFLRLEDYRSSVIRDLGWLLNVENLASAVSLEGLPEVQSSVLNYGIQELVGASISNLDVRAVESMLREAIVRFEPRLIAESVRVKASVGASEEAGNKASFTIEAMLWATPAPIRMVLRTELDLENGMTHVDDVTSA